MSSIRAPVQGMLRTVTNLMFANQCGEVVKIVVPPLGPQENTGPNILGSLARGDIFQNPFLRSPQVSTGLEDGSGCRRRFQMRYAWHKKMKPRDPNSPMQATFIDVRAQCSHYLYT